MATNVKTSVMPLPYSLGLVKPGATFATVSVPLTQNIVPVEQDGTTPHRMFSGIFITAFAGAGAIATNTGNIYICNTSAAPDLTNFTNVIAILQPGDIFPRYKEWSNNRDIGILFIGADNADDQALVSVDAF